MMQIGQASPASKRSCSLVLSNGKSFSGELIGAPIEREGQLVFTTGMVGYPEAITDPSYRGQILIFTYPLIGNYGVKARDARLTEGFESAGAALSGVVIGTATEDPSHWESASSLDGWLREQGVPGVRGIDTRQLVHEVRKAGRISATILPEGAEARGTEIPEDELVPSVSTRERKLYGAGTRRVALVDCGVKWNIVRELVAGGVEVELLPWDTDLSQVDCSAWVLSNGPGDPKSVGRLIGSVRGLLRESRPLLGICLGHQILSLAAGGDTEPLAYGHRGHNHPVQDSRTGRAYLTSQNHGYHVVEGSLDPSWEIWFRNLNDGSVEGIRHREKPIRGVQFHPEAAAGPRDTAWILEEFLKEARS